MKLYFLLGLVLPTVLCAPGDPAQQCDPAACELPNCLCSSTGPPGGLTPADIPQMVMLTFDDAITDLNFATYDELLFSRMNPNNCPVSATFFLTHEYNDYTLSNEIHRLGHEIALHSITHVTDTEYWKNLPVDGWSDEIDGLKEMLDLYGLIPPEDVQGMRAPFLQPGTNQYQFLHDGNYTWDCSLPTRANMNGWFPYTFDFASNQDCIILPCPTQSWPGLWEAPMVQLEGPNGYPCSMYDSCLGGNNTEDVFNNLKMNFDKIYNGQRSPFGVFIHEAWFALQPFHKDAYTQFLDYLDGLGDVYIVSISQVIEWMSTPTPTAEIGNFGPWSCSDPPATNCPTTYDCHYTEPEDRFMASCTPCPPNYPWLGNPSGQ